ncbi:MAG: HEAT repeat domain-containing protein [Candidatus Omnitrophica bacterium]|nr:HEAT repeat domain-containing protein [Candidatus Omnitrophota bacterium]
MVERAEFAPLLFDGESLVIDYAGWFPSMPSNTYDYRIAIKDQVISVETLDTVGPYTATQPTGGQVVIPKLPVGMYEVRFCGRYFYGVAVLPQSAREQPAESLFPFLEPFDRKIERVAAYAALGKAGDLRAVDRLLELLPHDPDLDARNAVVRSLGWLGDRRAAVPIFNVMMQAVGQPQEPPATHDVSIPAMAALHPEYLVYLVLDPRRRLEGTDHLYTALAGLEAHGNRWVAEVLDDQLQEVKTLNYGEVTKRTTLAIRNRLQAEVVDVAQARRDLDSPDPLVQEAAVHRIALRQDRSAIPKLLELLKAPGSWTQQVSAIDALGRLKAREAVPRVLAVLERPENEWMTYVAIIALGRIGAEEAARPLTERLLRSEAPAMRERCAIALQQIGPATIPTLMEAFSWREDVGFRVALLELFGALRDPRPAPLIAKYLVSRPYDDTGRLGGAALAAIGEPAVPALMAQLLADDDTTNEVFVVEAFGRIGPPATPYLLKALAAAVQTRKPAQIQNILSALSAIKDPLAAPALLPLLHADDLAIAVGAANTLGRIRNPEAIPALIALLQRAEIYQAEWYGAIVVQAVGNFQDPRVVPALAELVRRPGVSEQTLDATLIILGQQGGRDALDALRHDLYHEAEQVRARAVEMLRHVGDAREIPLVETFLQDETDPAARMRAQETLEVLRKSGGVRKR